MSYNLRLKATAIGSLPYDNPKTALDIVFGNFSDIPFWPQLAHVNRLEDMNTQYIQGVPGIKYDDKKEKYIFDTQSDDFYIELEDFFLDYEAIVGEKDFTNLEKYAITAPFSSSFDLYLDMLKNGNYEYAKGHVTGAFTWGTSICDCENQCSFYDETCREILVKSVILKAIWQIQKIKSISPDITPIIFFDEPVMSQYGTSAFVTVKRSDIVETFSSVASVVKEFGAISAIHCCGKSDWSLLIESGVDMINLDAYFFSKSLCTYHKEVKSFLEKENSGYIAWGFVPTLDKDALAEITVEKLEDMFDKAIDALSKKGIDKNLILNKSLITPSCGAGSLSFELAQKAMTSTKELSEKLQAKYTNQYEVI